MKYSPQLDGLRALAAGLVLLFHARAPGMTSTFLGVDVFFVLSGFLITQLLVDEHRNTGQIDLASFSVRRIKRLCPALFALLIVYLAIAPIVWSDTAYARHVQDALVSGLYMADYAKTFGEWPVILRHTWTLAVEMKFYLVWPFVLGLAIRLGRARGITLLLVLFVLASAWRVFNVYTLEHHWFVYERFDTHISGLILGSLIGFANLKLPARWGYAGVVLLGVALLTSDWHLRQTETLGFALTEIATALIISAPPKILGAGFLPWLGKMSYGLYLWHYLLIRIGRESSAVDWPEQLIIGGLGGLICAAISYYCIEVFFRGGRGSTQSDTSAEQSHSLCTAHGVEGARRR